MNKLYKALIEGRLLLRIRKKIWMIWKKFCKFCRLREERVDFFIGEQARKIYLKNIPVQQNKIVFYSFQGDYTDNPKYIAEELIRQNVDCEMVWIGRKTSALNPELFPKEISKVYEWWTLNAYEELASAKVLVLNSVELFKRPFVKKADQYIIETWHGSLGIKRFDKSVNHGKTWVKAAEYLAPITDYLISNSTFENDVYRNSFWPDTEILEYGHPRNDVLVNCSEEQYAEKRREIFEYLSLEDRGQKIALYAPTFRDSKSFACYALDAKSLIRSLSERFGGEWIALYRYHPTVRRLARKHASALRCVIDMTDYPDMQDLIQIADVGITDYSSWIYDFVLTRRPGFIFATDIDEYNTERGFVYPLESTPFPIATDNDCMMQNILDFDCDKYSTDVEAFLEGKGCFEDGHASERVVEKIKELIAAK